MKEEKKKKKRGSHLISLDGREDDENSETGEMRLSSRFNQRLNEDSLHPMRLPPLNAQRSPRGSHYASGDTAVTRNDIHVSPRHSHRFRDEQKDDEKDSGQERSRSPSPELLARRNFMTSASPYLGRKFDSEKSPNYALSKVQNEEEDNELASQVNRQFGRLSARQDAGDGLTSEEDLPPQLQQRKSRQSPRNTLGDSFRRQGRFNVSLDREAQAEQGSESDGYGSTKLEGQVYRPKKLTPRPSSPPMRLSHLDGASDEHSDRDGLVLRPKKLQPTYLQPLDGGERIKISIHVYCKIVVLGILENL